MPNTLMVRTWDLMLPRPSRVLVTNPDRQLPCHFSKTVLQIPSIGERPIVHIAVVYGLNRKFYKQRNSQRPIHNVRVRSIRPCSFPLKWRYGLTNFPIGTPRPQTNVSASLHCFVLDSASWDIAPVSRLNMCVLWKSWIAINRNERRNVNARSRNRYFQVKKCSSHLKPRRINAHKSF